MRLEQFVDKSEEPEKYPGENEDAAGQDKGNKLSKVKGDIATRDPLATAFSPSLIVTPLKSIMQVPRTS